MTINDRLSCKCGALRNSRYRIQRSKKGKLFIAGESLLFAAISQI